MRRMSFLKPDFRPTALATFWQLTLTVACLVGCRNEAGYPNRPITLVCPWAAGGGTDRVSRQMAAHLEHDLGVPVNVVNATGGKGVTGHSRGLDARPDGYTLTMITLELNMMHWGGLTELTYHDCIPLYSVNEDYGALLVRRDATWEDLQALQREIKAKPGQLKCSGTASGGAWHLGLAGWLISVGSKADDVVWVSSTGAGPSLQELISGGLDMVCCSLPEARTLLDSGDVRALGLMAPKRALGFDQVKTFQEQGTNWILGAWRGLAIPPGTPDEVVDVLLESIGRVVRGETKIDSGSADRASTFPMFMASQRFDSTFRTGSELHRFLSDTDTKLGALLTSDDMASVNTDRFSPMVFPNILAGAIACVLVSLLIRAAFVSKPETGDIPTTQSPLVRQQVSWRGILNFAVFVGATLAYLLLAETVGFVVLWSALLLLLLCWLGTRLQYSFLITAVVVPLAFEMFANVLRVPLPRGWLGW